MLWLTSMPVLETCLCRSVSLGVTMSSVDILATTEFRIRAAVEFSQRCRAAGAPCTLKQDFHAWLKLHLEAVTTEDRFTAEQQQQNIKDICEYLLVGHLCRLFLMQVQVSVAECDMSDEDLEGLLVENIQALAPVLITMVVGGEPQLLRLSSQFYASLIRRCGEVLMLQFPLLLTVGSGPEHRSQRPSSATSAARAATVRHFEQLEDRCARARRCSSRPFAGPRPASTVLNVCPAV